jgi:hypothetical protein
MSDMFNIRSFVGNQVDKLSTPTHLLVDRFRQTVDNIKLPFSTPSNANERLDGSTIASNIADSSSPIRPSESSSSSSVSSNDQSNHHLFSSLLPITRSSQSSSPNSQKLGRLLPPSSPLSSPKLLSNFKTLSDRFTRRPSILRRHVSESNPSDEATLNNHHSNMSNTTDDDKSLSQPIYHNNPAIDIQLSSQDSQDGYLSSSGRSRSLIRQSTDTTCTFPIRHGMRRMESIETVEIPGLNGVKSIRYLHDNLGKLQPDLYTKQALQIDPTYGYGKLTFTLHFNSSIGSLIVTIVSVDNLPYRDSTLKVPPDPYLKLLLLPDRRRKYQTKVTKRMQTVQINETFQFQITYEELRRRSLLLSIYDFGRSTKRSLIGTVKVDDMSSINDLTSHDVTCTRSIVPGTEVSSYRH